MAIKRFQLFNTMHGETIAIVEMEEALLHPDAGILDAETLTLRPIKNGGIYTLYPIVDHTIAILQRIRESHERLTTKPIDSLAGYIHNMDAMVEAVGAMFAEVSYHVIESADDLSNIINPPKGDYEPKMRAYNVMADLLNILAPPSAESGQE